MNIKIRLIIMNFLQFAVWGAYLTSMGTYLTKIGLGSHIGIFYAMQGIVSLFMPAILGIIADRWVPAQRLLGLSHLLAALFMVGAGYYGMTAGDDVSFTVLFSFYSMSVAFYMPTLALSNSVAYTALDKAGLDTIKAFPPIRTCGTIGFICSMWLVDLLGFQANYMQFFTCAVWEPTICTRILRSTIRGRKNSTVRRWDGICQMIILKKGKINKILSLFHWE